MAAPGNKEQLVEAAVLGAVQQVEQSLDKELNALSNLEDDDYEAIRKKRLAQMKKRAEDQILWKRRGHGALVPIVEKDFFGHCKEAERVVVMLTRKGTSRYSDDMENYFARVAEHHLETFFAVIDADKSPFLCEKFQIRVMPSIILVKNHEVDKILPGLDAFAQNGAFSIATTERRLYDLGMVTNTDIADGQ
eukprot:Plantae.Rhodophyta-Palmaria_palmata.ctg2885.p1 GENE.Plantae.Rhodophyta-Palmaria_palmata.ctg2885~~Plantae.Rhodophyta-Palmaria_palmata.ctg2885.p1  ORF type:complete len:192 (-),score=37.98 Plantae.Rhodophyta-Palmaria_palmata.ctg2885:248-823(-)